MPNDNTHTGIDDVLRVLNSRNANGEIEYGAYSELHDMISALSRTPAEPKAGDWERELKCCIDLVPALINAIFELDSDHAMIEIAAHAHEKAIRALSSAAPRITDVTSLQRYRLGLRVVDGIAEAPILEEDPNGSLVAFNHVLNLVAPAPRITENQDDK